MALTNTGQPVDSGLGTPITSDTNAATPPADGQGMNLGAAGWIAIGTAAATLMNGILAQRNAAKNRQFAAEQSDIARSDAAKAREEAQQERHQQNVVGAISNVGSRATQGAQAQGSALSGLASLFGGLR